MVLQMYLSLYWKPYSGCDIQNSECGFSGIMMRLKLVRHEESEDTNMVIGEDGIPHGTCMLKDLVLS